MCYIYSMRLIKTNQTEGSKMERRIYKITEKQEKRLNPISEDRRIELLKEFDMKKEKLGRKFGLAKRDFAAGLLTTTREYIQGCWQGKLDNCSGIQYVEKTGDKNYDLGYYRGYNENKNGYIDSVIEHNENFSHLK